MKPSTWNKARLFSKSRLFLVLVILLVVFVRIRLLDVPLERDEGEYAYMGQLILQGVPPYGEAYNMKFPGTYLMYAALMAIFGQTIEGIHVGLLIVNCAAALLVYLIARKIVDETPAAVAGGTYAVLSLSPSVFGFAAHATHFVVLPALGGTLLLLHALEKEKLRLYFLSGSLLGISVIMKQPGIFFVFFAVAYILYNHFSAGSSRSLKGLFLKLSALCMGASLPLISTALWLYAAGVFDRFWFWTVVYASRYATQVSFADGLARFKNSFLQVADGFFLFWIFAAFGFIVLFFQGWSHKAKNYSEASPLAGGPSMSGVNQLPDKQTVISGREKVNKAFIVFFAFFSFLSVLPGFYFRSHYYVTFLPAVSLLFSVFIDFLGSGRFVIFKRRVPKIIGAAIFVAAAALGVIQQKDQLFADDPVRLSELMYAGNPFAESLPVAKFINERTAPNDRIAVLGSEPQIFFYARRRSATGYIYTYSLMENHEYALTMQKEMIAEVEASKPKFLIDVRSGMSWQQGDNSETYIFGWLEGYIAGKYKLVGVVDVIPPFPSIYKWYDDAKNYRIQSDTSLLIYERQ